MTSHFIHTSYEVGPTELPKVVPGVTKDAFPMEKGKVSQVNCSVANLSKMTLGKVKTKQQKLWPAIILKTKLFNKEVAC